MKVVLIILGIMLLQFICFILSACLLFINDALDALFYNKKVTFKESLNDLINSKDVEGHNDGAIIYISSPLILIVLVILTMGTFMTIPFKLLSKITKKDNHKTITV